MNSVEHTTGIWVWDEKMEKWIFYAPGWTERKSHSGGSAETYIFLPHSLSQTAVNYGIGRFPTPEKVGGAFGGDLKLDSGDTVRADA